MASSMHSIRLRGGRVALFLLPLCGYGLGREPSPFFGLSRTWLSGVCGSDFSVAHLVLIWVTQVVHFLLL
jgi:hypothetical protein